MIKKYLPDIFFIVLFLMIALLAAEKPVVELISKTDASPVISLVKPAIKKEKKNLQREIVRDVVALKALKDRNIFSSDGKYSTSEVGSAGMKGPLHENPYTLIGIIHGEGGKAVFRDYKGSVFTLTVGKKLIDDYVITRIDTISVEVKKGKEKRELKIFDVKIPPLRHPSH